MAGDRHQHKHHPNTDPISSPPTGDICPPVCPQRAEQKLLRRSDQAGVAITSCGHWGTSQSLKFYENWYLAREKKKTLLNVFWTTLCSCTGAFALVAASHCTLTAWAQELEAEPSASSHGPRAGAVPKSSLCSNSNTKKSERLVTAPRDGARPNATRQENPRSSRGCCAEPARSWGGQVGQGAGELNKPSRFLRDKLSQQAVTKLTMTRERRAGWASRAGIAGAAQAFPARPNPLR